MKREDRLSNPRATTSESGSVRHPKSQGSSREKAARRLVRATTLAKRPGSISATRIGSVYRSGRVYGEVRDNILWVDEQELARYLARNLHRRVKWWKAIEAKKDPSFEPVSRLSPLEVKLREAIRKARSEGPEEALKLAKQVPVVTGIYRFAELLDTTRYQISLRLRAGLLNPTRRGTRFDFSVVEAIRAISTKKVQRRRPRASAGRIWMHDAVQRYLARESQLRGLIKRGILPSGRVGRWRWVDEIVLSSHFYLRDVIRELVKSRQALPIDVVAERFGYQRSTLKTMAGQGKVRGFRFKGVHYIVVDSVAKFRKAGTKEKSKDRFVREAFALRILQTTSTARLSYLARSGKIATRRWSNGTVTYSENDLRRERTQVTRFPRKPTKPVKPEPVVGHIWLHDAVKEFVVSAWDLRNLARAGELEYEETKYGWSVARAPLVDRFRLRSDVRGLIAKGVAIPAETYAARYDYKPSSISTLVSRRHVEGFRFQGKLYVIVRDASEAKKGASRYVPEATALRLLRVDVAQLAAYVDAREIRTRGSSPAEIVYSFTDISRLRKVALERKERERISLFDVRRKLHLSDAELAELSPILREHAYVEEGREYVARADVLKLTPIWPVTTGDVIGRASVLIRGSLATVHLYIAAKRLRIALTGRKPLKEDPVRHRQEVGVKFNHRDIHLVRLQRECGDRLEESLGRIAQEDAEREYAMVEQLRHAAKSGFITQWNDGRTVYYWRAELEQAASILDW